MTIYIIGSGGFARELAEFVNSGFSNFNDAIVLSSDEFKSIVNHKKITNFIVAIGDNNIRSQIYQTIPYPSECNLLLGSSLITKSADIGYGNVIMNNVTIANNVTIGSNCMIHGNTVVGHDCNIGNNVSIGANTFIGGNTSISSLVNIYPGVSIKNNINIEEAVTVGIGSCVIRSIKANRVVFGNPAKAIK